MATSLILCAAISTHFCLGGREIFKQKPLAYWQGSESRSDFLKRQWDGYRAYEAADNLLSPSDTVYLVNMKNYVYHLNCEWRSDFVFERYWLEEILSLSVDHKALKEIFLKRKITHLLMDEAFVFSPNWGLEQPDADLFREFLALNTSVDNRVGDYTLYRIMHL